VNTDEASLSAGVTSLGDPPGPKNLMIEWPNTHRNDSTSWIVVCAKRAPNIQLMNAGVPYVEIRKAQITLSKNIL